jgi:hypothetical protein
VRCAAVTFLSFERSNGHVHPHRDDAIKNYATVLSELGQDEAAIRAAIEAARNEAGLD